MQETAEPDPSRIAECKAEILGTLPKDVRLTLNEQSAFFEAVTRAVEGYIALTRRSGSPMRREHRPTDVQRYPAAAHRPSDTPRQALIGDLYDAYMTLRGDDIDARGFKKVADAVLIAANVPLEVTDNDRANLQERIQRFARIVAVDGKSNKPR